MPLSITSTELCRQTMLPMRQVQSWTESGVLHASDGLHPGRGGVRSYSLEELDVAKLLAAVSFPGISMKEILSLAGVLRHVIRAPTRYKFHELGEAAQLLSDFRSPTPESRVRQWPSTFNMRPRGLVAPTVVDVRVLEAWIAIEVAKRSEGSPQLLLYRELRWGRWLIWINPIDVTILATSDPMPESWRGGYVLNLRRIFEPEHRFADGP